MEYKYRKSFTYEGKRYNVFGNTLEEVYEKKARKIEDLRSGRINYTGSMTVREWTDIALDTYKKDVKGLPDMKTRINKHILSRIGNKPLKNVTPIECQQILNDQSGMSYSHVAKVDQELTFIFSTAVKNHLIPYNPAEDLVRPNFVKGSRRALTEEERYHFLKVTESEDRYILFLLMYYCGCRPKEAIEAVHGDIQDGMLHIRGTKTVNSDRYVPIPAPMLARIRPENPFYPISPNTRRVKHTESSYDRLTASLKRDMNISMGCKTYRNALVPPYPLADDFVPYNLRHTYCTDLARMGVDIRTAQRMMGHANISITADIYTHVDRKDIISAADLMDQFYAEPPRP